MPKWMFGKGDNPDGRYDWGWGWIPTGVLGVAWVHAECWDYVGKDMQTACPNPRRLGGE